MTNYRYAIPNYDNWLEPLLNRFPTCSGSALDVGCGPGHDSQVLSQRGFEVHACDISPEALADSIKLNPNVSHTLANARDLQNFANDRFSLVVASLSLHYFDRDETSMAFASIHRVLETGGLFLFRLNAWDDYEYGAPKDFTPWRLVTDSAGTQKQFFNDPMIRELCASLFELRSVEKKRNDRYQKPKSFFECSALKSPSSAKS